MIDIIRERPRLFPPNKEAQTMSLTCPKPLHWDLSKWPIIQVSLAVIHCVCRSVGMPKLETIHISNPSVSQPLHLNSISGDSPVFHASFFRSKVSQD